MTKFNWIKAFGFGLAIWAVMAVLVWASIASGIFASVWTQLALAVIAGIVAYTLTVYTQTENLGPAFGYGAMFVAIGIVLDLIISQQMVAGLFGMWTYYLAYAAILFAPAVEVVYGSTTSQRAI